MMMIYGMFVFELRTLPHQQLQQNKSWRHVKNERINRSASWQYIGSGEEQMTLSGVLYPEITGGEVSLSLLNTQAYTGCPWPLIDGTGQIYGMYVITGIQTTRSELDRYGKARKIEFSVSFQRCDEDLREKLSASSASDVLNSLRTSLSSAISGVV
ncbi:phage tail protein [Escherichia coli]|uniref:phage tail protein n=1 Tax=Escherichia coli TaxID=562 RepID=UPI000B4288A8|nr:phage tail protein [Escherichia coli]EFH2440665.1 phage tail protein [Escherichia coli]EHL9311745.1 phage tail protein [Escherichia coli]EJF3415162.1 phage tail protein [Escherichia coli]ELQ6874421.1 phage tail protein [Escherichia coli]MBB9957022.1 phage tail protein [Escherichia coli]